MRFSIFIHSLIFFALHGFGFFVQIQRIIDKKVKGSMGLGLDLETFFSSLLPIYLFQYIFISILCLVLFIQSQSYFAFYFSEKIKPCIKNEKVRLVLWATISNSALIIANAAWFKHSLHLSDSFYLWPEKHLNTYLCILIIIIPLIYYLAKNLHLKTVKTVLITTPILYISFILSGYNHAPEQIEKSDKPNIIFIGIDSLRNDLLISHMPFLSSQLKTSTMLQNAITPLGRTYPAWNTILTGQYPITHGARINLIGNDQIAKPEQFIGNVLKKEGYKRIFAIDETRFANLGQHHGFDHVISPRMGASDFIISSFSDFPLTNLLSLLPISAWLLPEVYANRGAATTYRAEAFSQLLNKELPPADQPTFLAVHYCLAHWPYFFSSKYSPEWNYPEPYYPANLKAIDDQLKTLFKELNEKGYLENSKIIFLSDHGEAWANESPKFQNTNPQDKLNAIHAPKVYGHGSTLVSNNNRVLIAFKGFEKGDIAKNAHKMTSLADIAPTLYNELGIESGLNFDGSNLSSSRLPVSRSFPVETGTILTVTEDNKFDVDEIVSSMLDRYQVNESSLVSIKNQKINDTLQAKNKGIFSGNLILSQFNYSQFRLFDIESSTFEHFNDLQELTTKKAQWSKLWCQWYKEEDRRCLTKTTTK